MNEIKRRAMVARTFCTLGTLAALTGRRAGAAGKDPALIDLPSPDPAAVASLHDALRKRRSVRTYTPRALSLGAVSQLLWAAQGVTAADGRRTAPSAGALYPLELQLAAARVEGLAPGLYRYLPTSHQLRAVDGGVAMSNLARAAMSQPAVADAAAVVAIAGVEGRTSPKYGARAGRYVAFEAGAVSQNLALQAAVLGLGTVVIGAFDDAAVARELRLGGSERPLALMPIGVPWP